MIPSTSRYWVPNHIYLAMNVNDNFPIIAKAKKILDDLC